MKKLVSMILGFVMLTQVASCGYLIHPDRRNQTRVGDLDTTIVILDGIGLLFFLIPGIIAFTVDFSTNTIYLPGNRYRSSLGADEDVAIKVDGEMTAEKIVSVVNEESGFKISLSDEELSAYKL